MRALHAGGSTTRGLSTSNKLTVALEGIEIENGNLDVNGTTRGLFLEYERIVSADSFEAKSAITAPGASFYFVQSTKGGEPGQNGDGTFEGEVTAKNIAVHARFFSYTAVDFFTVHSVEGDVTVDIEASTRNVLQVSCFLRENLPSRLYIIFNVQDLGIIWKAAPAATWDGLCTTDGKPCDYASIATAISNLIDPNINPGQIALAVTPPVGGTWKKNTTLGFIVQMNWYKGRP